MPTTRPARGNALVRLTPEHGLLLDRAVRLVIADYRRAGVRGVGGADDLLEVARQLLTDGVRVVVDPKSPALAMSGQKTPLLGTATASPHGDGATPLIDRPEAAALLRVSLRTLDRRVADGTLPCRHIGRRVLFDPAAITKEHQCTAS